MITDAFILMIVGMGVVFTFLILLELSINALGTVYKDHALKEEADIAAQEALQRKKKTPLTQDDGSLIAVISAAIHAFRSASYKS